MFVIMNVLQPCVNHDDDDDDDDDESNCEHITTKYKL